MSFLYHTFTNKSGSNINISYSDSGIASTNSVIVYNNGSAIQSSKNNRIFSIRG